MVNHMTQSVGVNTSVQQVFKHLLATAHLLLILLLQHQQQFDRRLHQWMMFHLTQMNQHQ
jgi:phage antirepressor YoqD-like protein